MAFMMTNEMIPTAKIMSLYSQKKRIGGIDFIAGKGNEKNEHFKEPKQ